MQYHNKLAMYYFILDFITQTDVSFNHIPTGTEIYQFISKRNGPANEKATLHLLWHLVHSFPVASISKQSFGGTSEQAQNFRKWVLL